MPIYQTVSVNVGARGVLHEEWARIEAAGKRPVDTEQRKRIHDSGGVMSHDDTVSQHG